MTKTKCCPPLPSSSSFSSSTLLLLLLLSLLSLLLLLLLLLLLRQRRSQLQELSRAFLIPCEREHRAVLELLGLEAFCQDPDLSTLRGSMLQLVELLASVSAGLPLLHHGFYCAGDDSTPR